MDGTVTGTAATAYVGTLMRHGPSGIDARRISGDAVRARRSLRVLHRLRLGASACKTARIIPALHQPRERAHRRPSCLRAGRSTSRQKHRPRLASGTPR